MTIRILLADDSALVRRILRDILQGEEDIQLAGEAGDGKEACELTFRLRPDLVLMDIRMPVMDGLEAIEEIMAQAPTPVLVLSGAVEASEVERAFTAIKRGALDVMEKPELGSADALEEFRCHLLQKVRLLARIRVIRHPRRRLRLPVSLEVPSLAPGHDILAIGASTGGPKAVMTLLKSLPAGFPATVFVVQHIAAGFAPGFASWLNRECTLPVRIAVDGGRYLPGEAVIAPDGRHMTLCDGKIRLDSDPAVNCCRPSIDVFFNSLAQARCDRVVSILLTGMGRDGALGMLRIKEAGGTTIVQDEPSCAVFGMPKAAISLHAVDQVLPLDLMPGAIAKLFGVAAGNEAARPTTLVQIKEATCGKNDTDH
ncbi:chemotaxis-specific protein-glutamate methyltransferase CheB [Citrifermentans bremense]|uniref:chemotaxis-specific protein-glutamate methyltransferase CheB n=1 Tax=Citrifermentans bremense TaxID=60035 RepID=UPI0004192245|nr:chemotaxis-specific protein-glutamate methyltransferase CheB [Citrifermentans bremense]